MKEIVLSERKLFLKSLLTIGLPISLQSLIGASLGMIDQLMIGQLGETAIAAVGIGGKPMFILLFVVNGIAGGTSVFVAQYWGKSERGKAAPVLGISLLWAGGTSLLLMAGCMGFAEATLSLFSRDPAVLAMGSQYLRIVSTSFLPLAGVAVYASLLRSTGQARLPMLAGFLSVGLNTLLNYLLIFGKWGFPALGVEGAAIATVISRFMEFLLLIAVIKQKNLPGNYSFRQHFLFPEGFLSRFLKTSAPLVATEFIWVMGDSLFTVIYGRVGTEALAAVTMSGPVQMLTIGFFTGFSAAAAVILGQSLGAGEEEKASRDARRFLVSATVLTVLMGFLVIFSAGIYVRAYNVAPPVRAAGRSVLYVFGFFLTVKVLNMISGSGILRSGGDTKFVMLSDSFGMWCIGIPLGFLGAFVLHYPIWIVYIMISVEEIIRLSIMVIRIRSGRWLNNLVSDI